jgi:hypothetical protein
MAFDASTFDAVPGRGTARFKADLPMRDYHDFFNSLSPNPTSVPGHVSFEVTWAGGGDRFKFRDSTFDYAADLVTGPATITFTASDNGSSDVYTSDAAGQGNPFLASVGHERNGVFFH